MIREKKRWLSEILVFTLLFTLIFVIPQEHAVAATKKVPAFDSKKRTVFLGDESSYVETLRFVNVSSKAQVTDVKISDTSVLKYDYLYNVNQGIYVKTLKTGSCKVSCRVKQGGKTYKLSTNITVKKADPFSYVKLNGKNVYKNGTGKLCNYWSDKSKVKVSYKLKKGWKLKTMYSNDHYRDSKKSKYVMTKDKKLKNGSSVKIQKGYTSVKIDVQNPKGEVYRYLIILNRKTNVKAAGAQSEPEIYITELGQVYDAD